MLARKWTSSAGGARFVMIALLMISGRTSRAKLSNYLMPKANLTRPPGKASAPLRRSPPGGRC